jgi:hypothetical protein
MEGLLTNTLPYLLIGLRIGIERAFPLTGLMSGACQSEAMLKPMIGVALVVDRKMRMVLTTVSMTI